ncbi:30S ribosomal protein S13 [Candidatus Woesearchaeota archaeon]|nr:30S ribosomal protein S13 [Candidatus Woesearchaeota archaeon]
MSEEKQQIKPFFRVLSTDLVGAKPISMALLKVKGISFNLSNAICNTLGLDKKRKAGLLTDKDAKDIENLLNSSDKLPIWFLNRRKDWETGENKHVTGGDLRFSLDMDLKRLKKTKSYRGMRHAVGLPTRGQRTRGHFRKVGKAVGVQKSKVKGGKKG